jgi:hypothetical protein
MLLQRNTFIKWLARIGITKCVATSYLYDDEAMAILNKPQIETKAREQSRASRSSSLPALRFLCVFIRVHS